MKKLIFVIFAIVLITIGLFILTIIARQTSSKGQTWSKYHKYLDCYYDCLNDNKDTDFYQQVCNAWCKEKYFTNKTIIEHELEESD